MAYVKLPERHKLHNVSDGGFPSGCLQQFVVTIQELHGAEICCTDPHYNDGHWQTRGLHNGNASLVHVCDDTICEDEQHKVLLHKNRNKGIRCW